MIAHEYTVIIEQDEEGFYVAEVPELQSCYTQAKSLDELMERVREVIELCAEQRDPNQPKLRFVAEVSELPGCMAHGKTQESALKSVKDAIALWLETAREFGDPIPEPEGTSVDAGLIRAARGYLSAVNRFLMVRDVAVFHSRRDPRVWQRRA